MVRIGIKSIYVSVAGQLRALARRVPEAEPADHHADRPRACSRTTEAIRLGVNEFLVKPISPKTLQQRLLSILLDPRPMVRAGKY